MKTKEVTTELSNSNSLVSVCHRGVVLWVSRLYSWSKSMAVRSVHVSVCHSGVWLGDWVVCLFVCLSQWSVVRWLGCVCVCLSQRSGFVSEPAVFVKYRERGSQVWSMDKFENKLIDMRDIYQQEPRKDKLLLPLQVYSLLSCSE